MLHNVKGNDLRVVLIVLAVLLGIQGHPGKYSQRPNIQRNVLPSGNLTWNRDGNKSDVQIRQPLIDNYESHVGKQANINNGSEPDGKIIFPDSDRHSTSEPKFNASSVIACENATFCEKPQFYPQDLIRRAISARQDLKYLATVDVPSEFDQRLGDNDESLCTSEEMIIFPKAAKNSAKEWMYVVNEENFPQGVRIETCKTEGSSCRIIEGLLATGYETFCKQKYVYRKLAALDSNNSVAADFFQFPSSCCCHIKFTGNLTTRVGIN